jgi:tricarballylate dehydrogenase
MADYDVIVVGAGNAALAASVSARNAGAARVLVLEKASEELRGGNTHYSGGLLRIAFDNVEEILRLVPKARELEGFVEGVEAYPRDAFWADLRRMTSNRTDPDLAGILIGNSFDTACWMAEQGIRFEPAISLGAVRVGNVIKWPKGAIVRAVHEGVGLSRMWFAAAHRKGVEIRYSSPAVRLMQDDRGRVNGVIVRDATGVHQVSAPAVVLGCGGFEANAAWRAQYLGRPWDHAKVRGTPHNQADGLRMAFEIGAMPWGQWSGCHATPINAEAPPFGDRQLTDKTNRLSYPYAVMLNREGRRFLDEGEDQAFFTYAKFGGIILNQPGGIAWQVFDAKVKHLLEPRYATSEPITAESLGDLVQKLDLDRETALRTLGVQSRGGSRQLQPGRSRRHGDARARAAEIELGAASRYAAVPRMAGHRRHHLLVRRSESERSRAGDRHRLESDRRPLHLRRNGRWPLPSQLSRRLGPHVRRSLRPHRRIKRRHKSGIRGWWSKNKEL